MVDGCCGEGLGGWWGRRGRYRVAKVCAGIVGEDIGDAAAAGGKERQGWRDGGGRKWECDRLGVTAITVQPCCAGCEL